MSINERAVVDSSAEIADGVKIGPWSVIGRNVKIASGASVGSHTVLEDVEIGSGTTIGSHVVIKGPTKIGSNNTIYQFASLGENPQHLNYKGEDTLLEIGDNNIIREFCTLNRGTAQGGGTTSIGNNNFLMAYVHIAHDCYVGNDTIFVNNASLAGHVKVQDYATIGGFVGIHQFCSIGAYSFITAAMVGKDVPPYVIVTGNTAAVCGLNTVGLKRRGFSSETITKLRRAYNILFRQGLNAKQALLELQKMVAECPEVQLFVDAIINSNRGLVR